LLRLRTPRPRNGAGVDLEIEGLDGASLVARFSGTAPPPWGGYGFRSKRKRAFVRGRWKAHSTDAGETWALYDIETDPGEATDRAGEEATTLAELVRAFESWQDDVLKDREDAPEASR
jgi:hypothetical protein